MTDESQDQAVLSAADRTLLKTAATPSDAQLEATRRAIGTRIAALAAGAAVAQAASTAEAAGAAVSGAAATTATAAATNGLALGAAKWISAGLIVTAVAGSTVVATRRAAEPRHAAVSVAAAAPRNVAGSTPQPEPAIEAPAALAVPAVLEDVEPASKPAPQRVAVKAPRRAAAEPKPGRAVPGESLPLELAILHDARQALARGDAGEALRALDNHASRFPNAVLRQEALSARALTLCALGRTADARRAAAQLERLAPRSPHLIRLADSCAQGDVDPSP